MKRRRAAPTRGIVEAGCWALDFRQEANIGATLAAPDTFEGAWSSHVQLHAVERLGVPFEH